MKTLLQLLGAAATLGVLAFAFGYFDPELADVRRWVGAGLIVASMATTWPAVSRLAEDWPRLKPQHNVDVAFAQIGLGVAALTLACLMGGRAGAFLAPLVEPTHMVISPGASSQDAGGAQSAPQPSRPARVSATDRAAHAPRPSASRLI
jgi:hypothetical protein